MVRLLPYDVVALGVNREDSAGLGHGDYVLLEAEFELLLFGHGELGQAFEVDRRDRADIHQGLQRREHDLNQIRHLLPDSQRYTIRHFHQLLRNAALQVPRRQQIPVIFVIQMVTEGVLHEQDLIDERQPFLTFP